MRLDRTLKLHDDILEEHGKKLDHIQTDLTDVKVRLGIKDKSNGQVVKYQKELVDKIESEKNERKEQDRQLKAEIKSIDTKIWFVVTGMIFAILIEVASIIISLGIHQ